MTGESEKTGINAMHLEQHAAQPAQKLRNGNRRGDPANAARCGAMTRKGTACQAPAIRGKQRCRMHGGTSPGAPKGNRNALKHGYYTAEAIAHREEITALIRGSRRMLREMG